MSEFFIINLSLAVLFLFLSIVKKIKKVKEINRNQGQGMIYTSRYYNLNIVSITYKCHNRIMKKKRKLSMLPEEVNMNTKNLK